MTFRCRGLSCSRLNIESAVLPIGCPLRKSNDLKVSDLKEVLNGECEWDVGGRKASTWQEANLAAERVWSGWFDRGYFEGERRLRCGLTSGIPRTHSGQENGPESETPRSLPHAV